MMRWLVAALLMMGVATACGDDDRAGDAGRDSAAPDAIAVDSATQDAFAPDAERDGSSADAAADAGPDGASDASSDAGPEDANIDAGPCTPFTSRGCADGFWCEPSSADTSMGTCTEAGPVGLGDPCDDARLCDETLICLAVSPTSNRCSQICDPAAAVGTETNDCIEGDRCANLLSPDGPLPIGVCAPSCDFDAGEPCRDGLTCVPSELVSSDNDLCLEGVMSLPEQGDCALAGIDRLGLCGPNRLCIDRADLRPGNLCYTICRESEGALGGFAHPDCADGQQCRSFAVGLGVCF